MDASQIRFESRIIFDSLIRFKSRIRLFFCHFRERKKDTNYKSGDLNHFVANGKSWAKSQKVVICPCSSAHDNHCRKLLLDASLINKAEIVIHESNQCFNSIFELTRNLNWTIRSFVLCPKVLKIQNCIIPVAKIRWNFNWWLMTCAIHS